MKKRILIIDDDLNMCKLLVRFLGKQGFDAVSVNKGEDAIELLKKETFDLLLLDFRLPDIEGTMLIKKVKVVQPGLIMIMITGYSDMRVAIQAIKLGAYDYVTKPLQPDEILNTVREALSKKKPEVADRSKVKDSKAEKVTSREYIFGESIASKEVLRYVELVAPTDMTVILQGETGTGKEYLARLIHEKSKRADKPFVAIDCGALSKELAASELFGHVKGAFTGALGQKEGSFEFANGGTLFLDEVGNLPYEIQVQLLRALQERKVSRVGSNEDIEINVRIIAATNDNLKNDAEQGSFREDLYHRLNEFSIGVPPLRSRKEDIGTYVSHFIKKSSLELNKNVDGLEKGVIEVLQRYPWYGNLREMKNAIKRATLLSQSSKITLDCLPNEIVHHNYDKFEVDNGDVDLKNSAANAERKTIIEALKMTNYNKTQAAKMLHIDRKTLYNKMGEYGIEL